MPGARLAVTPGWRHAIAVLLLAVGGMDRPAQAQPAFPPSERPPHLTATPAVDAIVVDGRLDEADWSRAAVALDFVQADRVRVSRPPKRRRSA